jgi:hypothetical protein
MRGVIDMRKVGLVAIAAALTIMWLGVCSVHPVLAGNSGVNALTATPEGKAVGATTGATAGRAAVSGGATARPTVAPGTYMVRTVWKGAPLPKVRVEWRRQVEDAAPELSKETIRFGTAIFRPASGSYYLTADWRPDGNFARVRKPGDRFAWLGGNPLLVSSEAGGEITLMLEEVPPPPTLVPLAGAGVFGRVTLGGVPTADVGVYAYAKTGSGFKGNDFQTTVRTNAKGEFTLELPPGRYYLLARLRADNSVDLGPLHKGDLLGYDPGNPIVVEEGRYAATAIPVSRLKMIKSLVESSTFRPGTIEGRIVDRDGRPVSGAYAALYQNPRMVDRPAFRSEPTEANGLFQLSVPVPGSYFLGARSGYGGAPAAGGWFGVWGGSADHSILIKTGEVRAGVEIVVDRLSREARPSERP